MSTRHGLVSTDAVPPWPRLQRWKERLQAAGDPDLSVDDPRALLDPSLWPWWLLPAEVLGQVGLVVLSAIEFDGAVAPVILLALALVPWNLSHGITRIHPLLLGALVLAPIAVVYLAGPTLGWLDPATGPVNSLMLLVLFAFHVGASTTVRHSAILGAGMMALPLAMLVVVPEFGKQVVLWLIALDLALVGGFLLARQTRLLLQLQEAQAALVDEAAARERRRIAREVHDVIAHSLAVTMLQVNAARMANERGEAGKVAEALHDAERVGRASLDEVRGTVRLLRDGDDPTAAALPTGADVGDLIAEHQAAGMAVDAHLADAISTVDGAVGLVVYRVVQESLTNAARHAPGLPVSVAIEIHADRVTVGVDNRLPDTADRRDVAAGMGLAGMRERVRQVDGQFDAERVDGRWCVAATIPRSPLEGRRLRDARPCR